ncbi:hypothetical protein [Streptomyces sp. WAC 06783]|uniref:hypothetical protein n=1 Tax=Streptomyces sp. WAC 06783 TaxID=2203211 RepID=UPI00163BB333|nr:hypothetical protein [Streptomyces sp. WAC 06783]
MNLTVDSSSPVRRGADGEVHRGKRAVVDAQREAVAVEDVEHVEDVASAAHEAEHPGDVHGVARPRVRQQLAELRPLGDGGGWRCRRPPRRRPGPRFGLAQDEVLAGDRLLFRRNPLVDQIRHRGALPYGGSGLICRQTIA